MSYLFFLIPNAVGLYLLISHYLNSRSDVIPPVWRRIGAGLLFGWSLVYFVLVCCFLIGRAVMSFSGPVGGVRL